MKPINLDDLSRPETNLTVPEPHVQIDGTEPKCLGCKEQLRFTNGAIEVITFIRMCEVSQSIFSCPECGCRMVIFPKGAVPMTSDDEGLTVHAPSEGYYVALAPKETP